MDIPVIGHSVLVAGSNRAIRPARLASGYAAVQESVYIFPVAVLFPTVLLPVKRYFTVQAASPCHVTADWVPAKLAKEKNKDT